MKGIILAGGKGTRLLPLTKVTNKHLLPVGRDPMIVHSVKKLCEAGINDIMIITGTDHMGDMINLLGSGSEYKCKFTYRVQDKPDGIAGALLLCEDFANKSKVVVILGDNIFEDQLVDYVKDYRNSKKNCHLLLKKVPDPERYGVAVIEDGVIQTAVEKPKDFISDLCITGIYMYGPEVFEVIKSLKPSARGEYEITEVNHSYIKNNDVEFNILDGWWTDAGTHNSYSKAHGLVNHNQD